MGVGRGGDFTKELLVCQFELVMMTMMIIIGV